jgi:flagellar hook-associated protein 2
MLSSSSSDSSTSSSTDLLSLLTSSTSNSSSDSESTDFLNSTYYKTAYGNSSTSDSKAISNYLKDVGTNSGNLLSSINGLSEATTSDDKVSSIKKIVSNYNDLLGTTDEISDSGASSLASQLKNASSTYGNSLSNVGISINSDGSLSVDEDTLKTASENGDLDNFLEANGDSGKSYGFLNQLQIISQNANDDPTYYISGSGKQNSTDMGTSLSNTAFLDNYYSVYSNWTTVGNLLDSMA